MKAVRLISPMRNGGKPLACLHSDVGRASDGHYFCRKCNEKFVESLHLLIGTDLNIDEYLNECCKDLNVFKCI